MTTPSVFHFYSELVGSPVLNGTAGSRIAVLDACLVTGFALKTADSLTVSGGKATLNFSTGHSYEQDIVVLVSGATPSGLNGLKVIESRNANAAVFDAAGIADGAATGTITVKIAPAGWEKVFSGTNLAVYRSADVTGTRMYLRVDDSNATNARVVGYDSMSDVNTGTRPFPTPGQISGGGYWPAANVANATARAWTIAADSCSFLLHMHTGTTSPGISGCVWSFGDFKSRRSSDPYSCELQCAASDVASSASSQTDSVEYLATNAQKGPFVARSFTGLGGGVSMNHFPDAYLSSGAVSGAASNIAAPTYPNGPDNSLILTSKVLVEPGIANRGWMRGVAVTTQNCHAAYNRLDKVDGQGDYLGRKLLAVKCGGPAGASSQGAVFFDITGPWA